jgi:hypothetical protein
MKRIAATLTAGLFAGAAFAQTTTPPTQATTPDSAMSPAVATAAAGHEKQETKSDAKTAAKTDAMQAKGTKHAKQGSGKHGANVDIAKDAKKDGAADMTTAPATK